MTIMSPLPEQCGICFVHSRGSVHYMDRVLFSDDLWSDARLVAVEGRNVKHVAMCANPDGFHLTISGQRGRMGGAARAKDLK